MATGRRGSIIPAIQEPPMLQARVGTGTAGNTASFPREIHDFSSETRKQIGGQRLRKEVRQVIRRPDERDNDTSFLHQLADEEVTPRDVLRPIVVLWIVGQVARSLCSQ